MCDWSSSASGLEFLLVTGNYIPGNNVARLTCICKTTFSFVVTERVAIFDIPQTLCFAKTLHLRYPVILKAFVK